MFASGEGDTFENNTSLRKLGLAIPTNDKCQRLCFFNTY